MKKLFAVALCLVLALSLVACGGKSLQGSDEPQYYEGGVGDKMSTLFFDFTVNSVNFTSTYGDITLDEDIFLVANVTVKNVFDKDITMFDTDFQAQWGDDADDAYCFPITFEYEDGLLDEMRQFPESYDLASGKSRTGELVYIVPEGAEEYSISYLEMYTTKDGEEVEGDVFFVYFRP
ncbi:MAG: DUF4352 domain-containing protein [Oscillospiraceae bacterium]|nr:DUF4352 domain-containing protein [Oscillospiraceae bacterium]